jgi:TonB-dependent receptor
MTRPLRVLRQAAVYCLASGLLVPSIVGAQQSPPQDQETEEEETEEEETEETEEDGEMTSEEQPGSDEGTMEEEGTEEEGSEEGEGETETEQMPSDAEMEAEMAAEMDAEAVNIEKPPAKGKGAIVGIITDTKFSEAIIEGRVQIIGQKRETFTDTDGRFRFELPPGTYSLRVSYEMHQPTRVDTIEVVEGQLSRIDAQLTPDDTAVETVEIEEEVDHTSLEGQTLQRQRSASVGDGVGRAEIARTPDRNAAEAAQRVVGATIVGSRFVYVRGLGERYTNALLNGTPLPSPEPDRQTVPLDLFPTLVLDSITITKQFTPDMPGDFAGGSVRINTREFPRQTLFQVSLTGGYNSETTFKERLGTHGSSTDALGYDDGTRQLPSTIPQKRLTDDNASEPERRYWGRWLNSWMSTQTRIVPPNHGIAVVAGDSWKVSRARKVGAVAALSYSHSYQTRMLSARRYRVGTTEDGNSVPELTDTSDGEQTIDGVRVGAFATVALELNKVDKLVLSALHSQAADDSATELDVYDDTASAYFRSTHIEYVSRALDVLQLRGTHRLEPMNEAELEWNTSLSKASREQPDTRDVIYRRSPATQPLSYSWISGATSGSHFYSSQGESALGAGLDYTQPISARETKLKLGTLLNSRDREFTARRFVLEPDGNRTATPPVGFERSQTCSGEWRSDCSDRLFRLPNIAPGGLILRETTQQYDGYNASLNVLAGYAMLDFEPIKSLRVVGGARIEHTRQQFTAFSPNEPGVRSAGSNLNQTDVLPGLSVVLATAKKSNARFGASRTLARPQLREISPFFSAGYTLDYPVQGNPDLALTKITNLDLRYETFPTLREVLAASVFYKHFVDPIEEVIRTSTAGNLITYDNAPVAHLVGVELESRKSLELISPALKDFMLIGNLTLAYSRLSLGADKGTSTNAKRPLSLQSPYIVNLSLDYANAKSGTDVRLLYNVSGPRITIVGSSGLPDTYEEPRHVVDLTIAQNLGKHFELKLTGQNLLRAPVEFRYRGAQEHREEDQQLVAGEKDPIVRRYNPGTSVTLGASYTY